MKKLWLILTLALIPIIFAFADTNEGKYNNKGFDYFFPKFSQSLVFDTLDDAKNFINAGLSNMEGSIRKSRQKGLGAKLSGAEIKSEKPVTVTYFFNAYSNNKPVDLVNTKNPLQKELGNATVVVCVFLIFYEDRGVSITNYYIADRYHFNSNGQIESFKYRGNEYKADYPFGWGLNNAIAYLNNKN